jgi:putative membrane protein
MSVHSLSHVNAALNATSAVLLVVGYLFIRRKRIAAHRACMIGATLVSAAFLASYVVYHVQVGSVKFAGQGAARPVYFSILITHVVLAAVLPILVGLTLWRAFRGRFERHRAIARWTLPIWLYVSVTGVLVYVMLYHGYSPSTGRS